MNTSIQTYHSELAGEEKVLCDKLYEIFTKYLPKAESKVWHGHPVWFLEGNPVVGYSKQKSDVSVLFWSGQSFEEPRLLPEGSFKAAEICYTEVSQIQEDDLKRYLEKAVNIQWDYKNIVKNKGQLKLL